MKINLINIKILRAKTPKNISAKNGETIQVEIPRFDIKIEINKIFLQIIFFSFFLFSCELDQKLTIDSQFTTVITFQKDISRWYPPYDISNCTLPLDIYV